MNTTEPFRPEERQTAEDAARSPGSQGPDRIVSARGRRDRSSAIPAARSSPSTTRSTTTATGCATSSCATSRAPSTPRRAMPASAAAWGSAWSPPGPGATNTVTGLADALMDSTPLVLVTGQVGSTLLGTDAFQETNFVGHHAGRHQMELPGQIPRRHSGGHRQGLLHRPFGAPGPRRGRHHQGRPMRERRPFRYERITSIRSYAPHPYARRGDASPKRHG